ncbi:MAG: T9SS type A sorting domain-containing protein [Chitinispirillia bacterium]|nr:T9SS type A sorting domain-containing protein [Chitinispirillia bacterium]
MSIRELASVVMITAAMAAVSFASDVSPKEISKPEDFQIIRDNIIKNITETYVLVNDIALPENFAPIGNITNPFIGNFDGKSFAVSGLNINRRDSLSGWAAGLFGVIGAQGKVKRVSVEGDVTGFHAAGVLAGINMGIIEWCHSAGSVNAVRTRENNAGGLVGINAGRISMSYSTASVDGHNAGGLAGLLTDGGISNSFAHTGKVYGTKTAGGLVGYVFGGRIENSYAAGLVEAARNGKAGGLIGLDFGNTTTWRVQGQNSGGSLVGNVRVERSFWDTDATKQRSSDGAGARGLSTDDMQKAGSFLGWDTSGIWVIKDGYPSFKENKTVFEYSTSDEKRGKIMVGGVAAALPYFSVPAGTNLRGPLVAAVPQSGFRFVEWSDGRKEMTRFDRGISGKDTVIEFFAKFEEIGKGDVIEISSIEELNLIGNDSRFPLNGNYELTDFIDGYEYDNFTPIGTSDRPFTGVLRGRGEETTILITGIIGSDDVGLFGYTKGAVIIGVTIQVEANGKNSVGTLVGTSVSTFIDSCAAIGGKAISEDGDGVGGLVGNSVSSVIIRSFSSSSTTGAGRGAGGLVGISENSLVTHSYSVFAVEAYSAAGGLVGKNLGGAVQVSYSTAQVKGTDRAGGLIGEISEGGIAFQSYSAGQVTGVSDVGGFVGLAYAGAITACYWDAEASGQTLSLSGGTGRSTEQMKNSDTYANWDIGKSLSAWSMVQGESYPFLSDLMPEDRPGVLKRKQTSSITRVRPFAFVNGRTLNINANPTAELRVSLIDMRGRTVARYNTTGSAKISLSKIPAGRYIAEAKEHGKRVNASKIIVR